MEAGVTVSVGAAVTARVMVWLAVRPSPAAVTVRVAALVIAVEEAAVKVRVSVLDPEAVVTELAVQEAVTPVGSPVIE